MRNRFALVMILTAGLVAGASLSTAWSRGFGGGGRGMAGGMGGARMGGMGSFGGGMPGGFGGGMGARGPSLGGMGGFGGGFNPGAMSASGLDGLGGGGLSSRGVGPGGFAGAGGLSGLGGPGGLSGLNPGPLAGGAGRGPAGGFGGLGPGSLSGLNPGGLSGMDRGSFSGLAGAAGGRGPFGIGGQGFSGAGASGGPLTAGRLNSFLGLPSDEGLHNLGGGGGGPSSVDRSSNLSGETLHGGNRPDAFDVNHGSVEGPRGGYAAGTTITGPGGRTVGRGATVGPYGGVTAGRFASGPDGFAGGFAHVSPSGRYTTARTVRGNFNHFNYYHHGWYADHPGAWFAAGWAAGAAWEAATWPALNTWFGYAYAQPVYYDYGQTVTYQDNSVTVNGQDVGTPEEYTQQATDLAAAGAQADAPSDGDWLPLGVWALAKTDAKTSDVTLQLAVNHDGVIRGNSTDSLSGQTQTVQGSVDKSTQRVAFTVGDNATTVVETGLYNLTKDEAPALIHFGADRTEQWLLVRLKNQDAGQDAQQ